MCLWFNTVLESAFLVNWHLSSSSSLFYIFRPETLFDFSILASDIVSDIMPIVEQSTLEKLMT